MINLKEKISVIIPAYEEGALIRNTLLETIKTFNDFSCDYEIILMDDGSGDETFCEAQKLSLDYPQLKIKRNPKQSGKGRALKKAFRYVEGAYVVFLDADLDLHPGQVQTFFDIMRLDNADVVIGSKLHPNSVVAYPLMRRIISYVYYLLIKILFGLPLRDTQTGLKIFKTHVLREVFPRLLVKKFAFDLELLANIQHLGYKIAEAPIVLEPKRTYGRIGLKAIAQTGWDTLAIFYRMKIMKYYDRPLKNKENE